MSRTLIATRTTKQTRTIGEELNFICTDQARIATEHRIDADQRQHIEDDLAYEREYQAWKKANGLGTLDRAGFETLFDPNFLYN
jgi:hypothetical protein